MRKVHPGVSGAGVSGCTDCEGTRWCWWCQCLWQYRWRGYVPGVTLLMLLLLKTVKTHFGVGIADGICLQVAKEHPGVGQLMLKVEMV